MQKSTTLHYDSIIAEVMLSALFQKNNLDFVDKEKIQLPKLTKNDQILLDENKFESLKNRVDLITINPIVKNTIIKYIDPEFEPHEKWLLNYTFSSSLVLLKRTYQWWLQQPQPFLDATESIMFEVKLLLSGYNKPV